MPLALSRNVGKFALTIVSMPVSADRRRDRLAVDEQQECRRFHDVDRRRLGIESFRRRRFDHAVREMKQEDIERNFERLAFHRRADVAFLLR